MKALFIAVLGLTLVSGVANAQQHEEVVPVTIIQTPSSEVVIPATVTESKSLVDSLKEFQVVQAAQISAYLAQESYYQMMLWSFEASHAMSMAFEKESSGWAKAGGGAGGTVTVVADATLAAYWLRGAIPTASLVKDIWAASGGNVNRFSATTKKVWESLKTVMSEARVPKNFITTASLGALIYIQKEDFFVINMSEAQYQKTIAALKANMAINKAAREAIADMHVPNAAK